MRFTGPFRARGGFSLTELLVVIAVIAVLLGVMMPALAKARQASVQTQCAANLRSIGQAMHGFANAHDGRLPNAASGGGNSYTWDEILNRDVFRNYQTKGGTRITLGETASGSLGCPAYVATKSNRQSFAMNRNAAGGEIDPPKWPAGPYGKAVSNPQTIHDQYANYYRLGAKITWFKSSSKKFLVIEHEDSVPYFQAKSPYKDTWTLGDTAGSPAWTGFSGVFSFRHGSRGGNERANALFVDGHVEVLTPKDEFNTKRRWNMDLW